VVLGLGGVAPLLLCDSIAPEDPSLNGYKLLDAL
jgi:hypothetical protein